MPLNIAEQDVEAGTASNAGVNPIEDNTTEGNSCTQQVCDHVQVMMPSHACKECAGNPAYKNCLLGSNIGSTCSSLQRRAAASRSRLCDLLADRGARRTWRRPPSERQVALEKKYADLLQGDDGRTFCTFNG